MPQVLDWQAVNADGKPLSRREFIGTGNLPLGGVRSMAVQTTHPGAPIVKVACSPERDETIRVFTRRSIPVGMGGGLVGNKVGEVVVIEIANAVTPGRFVRLYLRDGAVILSSEEIHG